MEEKKMLGDFIYLRRREKGYSQAQLGEMVGVSNKAVSKWETGEANPDVGILGKLAKVLGVTADELLNCELSQEKDGGESLKDNSSDDIVGFHFGFGVLKKVGSGEYKSKMETKKGTPFVHINFSGTAKGIVAIGFKAKGIISLGIFSFGLLSLGIFSIGLFAIGIFTLGLLASIGGVAVGLGASVGGVAVGIVAVGGVAVGFLAVGGVSIGYYAHTAIDGIAFGKYIRRHENYSQIISLVKLLPVLARPVFLPPTQLCLPSYPFNGINAIIPIPIFS